MLHTQIYAAAAVLALGALDGRGQDPEASAPVDSDAAKFHEPVRVRAGGDFIKTEASGYATPAWFDVTGDGKSDLVVGQFDGGKMHVFESQANGQFAPSRWLEAGGEVAKVPGVW